VQAAALTPSQSPPQVPAPAQGARLLRGAPDTVVQMPMLLGSAQASQLPPQGLSQHTSSMQVPEEHSLLAAQFWPFGFCVAQVLSVVQ
jgi:hypothetical protein